MKMSHKRNNFLIYRLFHSYMVQDHHNPWEQFFVVKFL